MRYFIFFMYIFSSIADRAPLIKNIYVPALVRSGSVIVLACHVDDCVGLGSNSCMKPSTSMSVVIAPSSTAQHLVNFSRLSNFSRILQQLHSR
jgi:hypothetical protein